MDYKKRELELIEEEVKKERKRKRKEAFIVFLAILSIFGFGISLLFLIGITGAAIGPIRGNLFGMIIIIISLLTWAVAELIWMRSRKKKEMDIKKLLGELEGEGFPMLYNKYIKKAH